MPEHVHLLVHPRRPTYRMAHILGALKRPVSTRAKRQLIETNNGTWLARLTVQEGKKSVFRFWQAGGGYDENLWNERPIHEVIAYIHANPIRRGLVENPTDWLWSSARFWAGESDCLLSMEPLIL
jgi:putative transposase